VKTKTKPAKPKKFEVLLETPDGVKQLGWFPLGSLPLSDYPQPPWLALWWTDSNGRDILSLISPELLKLYHDEDAAAGSEVDSGDVG